eukprot:m.6952 g.6952  ORF g.6952 m.6952 type:complete len:147 (+) comp17288_c0_seq1:39-479(+)
MSTSSSTDLTERRHSCIVCLSPKLRMVWGLCQHRVCADCLYNADGWIIPIFESCPICHHPGSFPKRKPIIPEENIDIQINLGVTRCTVEDCPIECWNWEIDDHIRRCHRVRKRQRRATTTTSKQTGAGKMPSRRSLRLANQESVKN